MRVVYSCIVHVLLGAAYASGIQAPSITVTILVTFSQDKNFEESLSESESPHTPLTHTFLER